MASRFKPISISLSPNVQKDDVRLAWQLIIRPWLWKKGKSIGDLEKAFQEYLGVKHAISFNSGRSSLYAILRALQLPAGAGALLQAFTCNAVPNPILWAGLEPIYVDCNTEDYNIDMQSLRDRITPQAKVLIVQHTFGQPANMDELMALANEKGLTVIEDCAHALGSSYQGKLVGTFGKAAFFSFSRDKVISSVYGGMAVTNDDTVAEGIRTLQKEFKLPGRFWILQQLLHPILLAYVILPSYNFFNLGKVVLIFSQIAHILSKAVSWQEKQGKKPPYFPKALPNALAIMALHQFNKLEVFNHQRQLIAAQYYTALKGSAFGLPKQYDERRQNFLRFAVQHPRAHEIIEEAWSKQNILIGDWYTTAIAPFDTNMKEVKYVPGSCPNAEWLAKRTLNLPTHINMKSEDIQRVLSFLQKQQ